MCIKSPDSEYQFSDFLSFLKRTANGDVVFTLKMGCPIEKFRVKLNSFCGVVAILGVARSMFGVSRGGVAMR